MHEYLPLSSAFLDLLTYTCSSHFSLLPPSSGYGGSRGGGGYSGKVY